MIWIDIDNPPQVQYLLPFKQAFEKRGYRVALTARDYAITFDILRQRGVEFSSCGKAFGKSRARKVWGTLNRTAALLARFARQRPTFLISASRSAALAARLMNIPSFIFCDYEFAELGSFRSLGSHLVFPSVIGANTFLSLGFTSDHLIPFSGIKEHLSFSNVNFEETEPYQFNVPDSGKTLVLFRPPAVESHYHAPLSGDFASEVLKYLSEQSNVVVIFSPRYPWQVSMLDSQQWLNPPVMLEDGIEFVSLLKGVDAVVTSGGTMAREAAYLGIPAFSIFKGKKCAVDNYLESLGKLVFIENKGQLNKMSFRKKAPNEKPENGEMVLENLVTEILKRASNAG